MTEREIFRKNLAELMKEENVKQIDVAKYAEVSYQTVSAWVCGRGYPRADAMARLCKFFGVKQSELTEKKQTDPTDEDLLLSTFAALSSVGKQKLLERAFELKKLYPRRNRNG